MNTPTRTAVVLAVSWLATAVPLVAQKAKPKPDKEVAAKVERLKEIAKDRKFEKDAEGVGVIEALIQKQKKGLHDKDHKMVVKVLDGVLNSGKVRPPDRTQLLATAANALGGFGEDGAKVLKRAYDNKNRYKAKPEWVPLRKQFLLDLGKTKDEDMVEFLLEEARRNPEATLQAAAGTALGNFVKSKEKVRKQIVKELLTRYGSLDQEASVLGSNIDAQNAKDRLATIEDPWNKTLAALTGQKHDSFRKWQAWYSDNKNEKW